MNTCETCKFWYSYSFDKTQGECRAHAPIVVKKTTGDVVWNGLRSTTDTEWPRTTFVQWCGDYQIRQ